MSAWVKKFFKKYYSCEKDYIWNASTSTCEHSKYLENVIDDSVVMFGQIIEAIKIKPIVFDNKMTL